MLNRTCANTIYRSKWLFSDTVSKSVMFLASKSCLLNLQYFVTSLTSEQQLCRICPSSGLQHFRGSFWINKSLNVSAKFMCHPSPGAGQRRCIGWNIQPQRWAMSAQICLQYSFHIFRAFSSQSANDMLLVGWLISWEKD